MAAHERRMNVDLTSKEIGKFKLGDKVTMSASGEIFELTAKNPYGAPTDVGSDVKSEDIPPSVGIKISGKVKLIQAKSTNTFAKMADEDEGD